MKADSKLPSSAPSLGRASVQKWAWISSWILIISTAGPAPGGKPAPFAAGTTLIEKKNKADIAPEAIQDPIYEKCGQECLYGKANENLTLQIDFLRKKEEFLIVKGAILAKARDEGASTEEIEKAKGEVKQVLGGFCRSEADEELVACLNRYLESHRFLLLKSIGAIGVNDQSRASLVCTKFGPNGICEIKEQAPAIGMIRDEKEVPKLAQVPHFTKSSELAKYADNLKRLQIVQDYQEHDLQKLDVEFVDKLKPELSDFIKFKTIDRDPSHPAAGKLDVPDLDSSGKVRYDNDAFKKAMKAWEALKDDDTKLTKRTPEELKQKVQESKKKFSEDFKGEGKTEGKKEGRSLDRKLYDQARGEYIQKVNQMFQPAGRYNTDREMSFRGQKDKETLNSGASPKTSVDSKDVKVVPMTGNEEIKLPPRSNDSKEAQTGSYSRVYSPSHGLFKPEPQTPAAATQLPSSPQPPPPAREPSSDSTGGLQDVTPPSSTTEVN